MSKLIKDFNILIVEDENKNIEILERILLGEGITNIRTCSNTLNAIELMEKEYPDLILLDLKIPYADGGIEDSVNSFNIIMQVERINRVHDHQIRIIIISGTTQERGLQKLIEGDKTLIQYMFDKGMMGDNPAKFTSELIVQINNLVNFSIKKENPTISLSELRLRNINKLKTSDNYLYELLNNYIFNSFEKIDAKTENDLAFAIIVRCGIIVEYLIEGLNSKTFKLNTSSFEDLKILKEQSKEFDPSIKAKLIELTGRKSEFKKEIIKGKEKWMECFTKNGKAKISRQAADFALKAYYCRSDAGHSADADPYDKNIFSDLTFTKDHALTSISLIMPLIQDYIKYKSN